MVFQFDGREFLEKFNPRYSALTHCVKSVILPDGRVAQIQITITAHESDFCTKIDTMSAVLNKVQ